KIDHDDDRCPGETSRAAAAIGADPRLADDDRSQEDRDHVSRQLLHVLRVRWGIGAADAYAADEPRQYGPLAAGLQRGFHHARDDHDLPGDPPPALRVRELFRAAADRRARHG